MTINDPSNGGLKAWFARWSMEFSVAILSATMIYGATVVRDLIRFDDRMTASETDRAAIHTQMEQIRQVQIQNSEFREAARVRFDNNDKQLDRIEKMLEDHVKGH